MEEVVLQGSSVAPILVLLLVAVAAGARRRRRQNQQRLNAEATEDKTRDTNGET
jgi:MYXO-CTERM domain-containing protein